MGDTRPTIYVVDDDPDVCEALAALLESYDLSVSVFHDGQTFLDTIEPLVPGCIILDMWMPGLSGNEVLERLRDKRVTTPVIILTGHGDIAMANRAIKNGAFAIMENLVNLRN